MSSGSFPTLARNFGLGDKHTVARESSDPVPLYLWQVQPRAEGKGRPTCATNAVEHVVSYLPARRWGQPWCQGVRKGPVRRAGGAVVRETAELQAIWQELAGVVVH